MAAERPHRDHYSYRVAITTRWMDNDIYGHINNVAYYSYFDSAANRFLIEEGGLDIVGGDSIALVVASGCAYHAPVAYPSGLVAGVRVDRLGQRAVTYGIAIFIDATDAAGQLAVAHGHFVHVWVDRTTRRPVAIPAPVRAALERLTTR
jgi:acyl-CoA thioester hydrolase